jgi:RNA polymerase sigma-70 factor (ECF subfamily)
MPTESMQRRFERLTGEHGGIVSNICRSYCGRADDREDLAQEIVVALWRSFPRFDGRVRFSTWMYRVALNTAISFGRRENVRMRHRTDRDPDLLASRDAPVASNDVAFLYRFVAGLDGLNKALLLLYLEDDTYREIADVLGLTETNVATKLNRLKAKMKNALADGKREETHDGTR